MRVTILSKSVSLTDQLALGATALLAAVNPAVRDLGWYFLPVVLLSASLSLTVALIINNIRRCYPTFWFTPDSPMSDSAASSVVSLGDTIADTRSSEKAPVKGERATRDATQV